MKYSLREAGDGRRGDVLGCRAVRGALVRFPVRDRSSVTSQTSELATPERPGRRRNLEGGRTETGRQRNDRETKYRDP